MPIHPRDSHWFWPNSIIPDGRFQQQIHMSTHPRDIHRTLPTSILLNDHSQQQSYMSIHPSEIHWLWPTSIVEVAIRTSMDTYIHILISTDLSQIYHRIEVPIPYAR